MSVHRSILQRIAVQRDPRTILELSIEAFPGRVVVVSSLGPQTLVTLDLLHKLGVKLPTVLLDTGLLFEETHTLRRRLEERYDLQIQLARPRHSLAEQARREGEALWERDPDRCCALRKVEPLREALVGADAWITGLRRDQGQTRSQVESAMWDLANHRVKISPLAWWSRAQVFGYLFEHDVPFNPLLEEGYASVGCTPCTHPVTVDEVDERAGRWKGRQKTECGLHVPAGLVPEPA
jgi:phosphoadenosine phosphosulfate reductase